LKEVEKNVRTRRHAQIAFGQKEGSHPQRERKEKESLREKKKE